MGDSSLESTNFTVPPPADSGDVLIICFKFADLVILCIRVQVGAAAGQGTEQMNTDHNFPAKDVRWG